VESVEVGTNSNVPNALIYPMPKTALEGKFSIPFCMAIAILERRAGIAQFVDEKVRRPKVVALMKRVRLYVDDEMERLGYDQVRSKIRIKLSDGRTIEGRADVARGHPQNPMSWQEVSEKFFDCAALALPRRQAESVVRLVERLPQERSLAPLLRALTPPERRQGDPKRRAKARGA
jgi:2-methylcitrate dehydratase PrpD